MGQVQSQSEVNNRTPKSGNRALNPSATHGDKSLAKFRKKADVKADTSSEQMEREVDVTVIEQRFTNVNRCLYIVKVERLRAAFTGASEHQSQNKTRDHNQNFKPLSINNMNLRVTSSQVKEELKNFQFEIGEDQRFTCRPLLTSRLRRAEEHVRLLQNRLLFEQSRRLEHRGQAHEVDPAQESAPGGAESGNAQAPELEAGEPQRPRRRRREPADRRPTRRQTR